MASEDAAERAFFSKLVVEIRRLISIAVNGRPEDSALEWTEMRWDSVDVTASWSRGGEYRNIHGWLTGGWPSFVLSFEGAAWEDDETNLRRRVVFLSGPATEMKIVEGGMTTPKIRIKDHQDITIRLRQLAEHLESVRLEDVPWAFRLSERPPAASPPQT